MKNDFPTDLYNLLNPSGDVQKTKLNIGKEHFNWLMVNRDLSAIQKQLYLKPKNKKTITNPASRSFDGINAADWVKIFNSELNRTTVKVPDNYDPVKELVLQFGSNLNEV